MVEDPQQNDGFSDQEAASEPTTEDTGADSSDLEQGAPAPDPEGEQVMPVEELGPKLPATKMRRTQGKAKAKDVTPRKLRTRDKVLVTSGVAAGKVGVVSSIDNDRPDHERYYVVSDGRVSEDKQVMGRFGTDELERIL